MSDSLNILVDARPLVDPAGGGVRRVTKSLLTHLLDQMPDVAFTFVTTGAARPTIPHPFDASPRVTHIHINLPNKLWSLLAMFGTAVLDREASKMQKVQFDGTILPNIGFTGFLTIPYVLVLHDLSFIMEPRWFTPKVRLWHQSVNARDQIRRAAKLICVSETTARDTERLLGIPKDRIETFRVGVRGETVDESRIIPIRPSDFEGRMNHESRGLECSVPRPPAPLPSSLPSLPTARPRDRATVRLRRMPSPYVLAFGETNPRKNIATAIAAVERLRQEEAFGDLRLIIIGARDGQATRDASPWIVRMNNVTDEELDSLYAHAYAFLYPSWYEGFGLPLHEAARFNIPCLASCHGALPETSPPGTILLPPAKPHLWVAALREILRHPESFRTAPAPETQETDVAPFLRWLQALQDNKKTAQ
jgi:glycosyltransferase involved in cell wall biosynthesis